MSKNPILHKSTKDDLISFMIKLVSFMVTDEKYQAFMNTLSLDIDINFEKNNELLMWGEFKDNEGRLYKFDFENDSLIPLKNLIQMNDNELSTFLNASNFYKLLLESRDHVQIYYLRSGQK